MYATRHTSSTSGELEDVSDKVLHNTFYTEPMMQTTQHTTWCCHQDDDDDDLFNSDDQDCDSDPVAEQGNTEERLMSYNEFPKPEAVKTRDNLNDLDSVKGYQPQPPRTVTARMKMLIRRGMKMMMRRKKMKMMKKLHRIAPLHKCTAVSLGSSVCDLSRVLICKTK